MCGSTCSLKQPRKRISSRQFCGLGRKSLPCMPWKDNSLKGNTMKTIVFHEYISGNGARSKRLYHADPHPSDFGMKLSEAATKRHASSWNGRMRDFLSGIPQASVEGIANYTEPLSNGCALSITAGVIDLHCCVAARINIDGLLACLLIMIPANRRPFLDSAALDMAG